MEDTRGWRVRGDAGTALGAPGARQENGAATGDANRAARRNARRGRRAGTVLALDAALALGFAAAGLGATAPTAGANGTSPSWSPTLAPLPGGGTTKSGDISHVDCLYAGRCVAIGSAQDATGNTYGLIDSLSDSTWTAAAAPLPPEATSTDVVLDAVSCASADWCMVVGHYATKTATTTVENPFADVWDGSSWAAQAVPVAATNTSFPFAGFNGLDCVSSGDCTALVSYKGGEPPYNETASDLIATFTGGAWTSAPVPVPAGGDKPALDAISCQPGGDCVAVGDYKEPGIPITAELGLVVTGSGTSWTAVATAVPSTPTAEQKSSYFTAVSCGPTSCTAVGGDEVETSTGTVDQLLAGTLAGGSWSGAVVPLPSGPATDTGGELTSVSCTTTGWCGAVGYVEATDRAQPVAAARPAGGSWSSTLVGLPPLPATAPATHHPFGYLTAVSCSAPGQCSAVGYSEVSGVTGQSALVATLAATSWTAAAAPLPSGTATPGVGGLADVDCVPQECVAGGNVQLTGGDDVPLLETDYQPTGYDLVGADGGVFVFNPPNESDKGFYGSLPGIGVVPNKPVVGIVPTVTDTGYFLVAADGGVFAFGQASFLGSLPGLKVTPNLPIVGIVAANTDKGYFLVGGDGGVYAFGTVPFLGSLPGKGISVANVIGIAATPTGNGYWVVQATGKVTAFGTAQAFTTLPTTSAVTAIAGTPTGGGYWLVTKEGGVYPYGNATKQGTGTLPAIHITPNLAVIGIVRVAATVGYWLIGKDGGIFAFGTAPFVGSLPGLIPPVTVTDIVGAVPNFEVARLVE